jgi:hypothetical protein
MPTELPPRRPPVKGSDRTILILFAVALTMMGLALAETAFTDTSAVAGGKENSFREIATE